MKSMLRDSAYHKFKELLFEKSIKPGEFVSQQELADRLGFPVGPTREALKRLESEDLVELVAQRGIQIRYVNVDLIKNVCQLREVLELGALEVFIQNATDQELAELKDKTLSAREMLDSSTDQDVLDEVTKIDHMLHHNLIASMGNEIYQQVYDINFDKIRLIRLQGNFTAQRAREDVDDHLAVIEACEKHELSAEKKDVHDQLAVSKRRSIAQE